MNMTDVTPDGKTRLLTINDRNYQIQQRDPHGFCYVVCDYPLNDILKGAFTTFTACQNAIEVFENNRIEELNKAKKKSFEPKV